MSSSNSPTRVALTGAAGFLGRALAKGLAAHFPLRTLDVQPTEGDWEQKIGSVAKLDDALALCDGCSHLVIGHMAPNRPEIYRTPPIPFEVNVTGAANLFHAACEKGIKRVIVISSTSVVAKQMDAGTFLSRDLPLQPNSMYSLTKTLQESIAEYYHREKGIEIAHFRPAHIIAHNLVDKYDRQYSQSAWNMIDPRDIAEGVRLALQVPKLQYEIFYILGHVDSDKHADVKYTRDFLGWSPRYNFL